MNLNSVGLSKVRCVCLWTFETRSVHLHHCVCVYLRALWELCSPPPHVISIYCYICIWRYIPNCELVHCALACIYLQATLHVHVCICVFLFYFVCILLCISPVSLWFVCLTEQERRRGVCRPYKPSPLQLQWRESRAVEHTWLRERMCDWNSGLRMCRMGSKTGFQSAFVYGWTASFFFLRGLHDHMGLQNALIITHLHLHVSIQSFVCIYIYVCVSLDGLLWHTQAWFSARAQSYIHLPLALADGLPVQ